MSAWGRAARDGHCHDAAVTELPPPADEPSPRLPRVLWAFGWSFVGQGVLQLVVEGPKDDAVSIVVSVVLSVLLSLFFSVGVVQARGFRTAFVAVVVAVALLAGIVGLVVEPTAMGAVAVVFAGTQAWLLWSYTRTTWWAWQRTRPEGGPSLGPILAVAALAGVLGGAVDQPVADRDASLTVHVG